eukprot:30331-Ditylum_brightwellii.AAC.2
MTPSKLRSTRTEYKEFQLKVFKQHIYQEICHQKFVSFLEWKRTEKQRIFLEKKAKKKEKEYKQQMKEELKAEKEHEAAKKKKPARKKQKVANKGGKSVKKVRLRKIRSKHARNIVVEQSGE